ncbi:hypothetical protein M2263_000682 [Providencia alcalifaciens]|nr:hypothetical protein [Providencia alcalifaciens]
MSNIGFFNNLTISLHKIIGGNISKETANNLLDKIKNIYNKGGTIPQNVIDALEKNREKPRKKSGYYKKNKIGTRRDSFI